MSTDITLTQVSDKIEVEPFNPMSRRNPSSRYWQVFPEWKKVFKKLNSHLQKYDKSLRKALYTQYYNDYYKKHYTASCC